MCGKNGTLTVQGSALAGSPPRVREKLEFLRCQLALLKDHPRVCGKNSSSAWIIPAFSGSHPRVREKRPSSSEIHSDTGITPACAGKTPLSRALLRCPWDHPRVCGKNLLKQWVELHRPGSPPRVREKPAPIIYQQTHDGITPACAGKTNSFLANYHEHKGSPPRVREKP